MFAKNCGVDYIDVEDFIKNMRHIDFMNMKEGDIVMMNGVHCHIKKIDGDSLLIEYGNEKAWVKYYELD